MPVLDNALGQSHLKYYNRQKVRHNNSQEHIMYVHCIMYIYICTLYMYTGGISSLFPSHWGGGGDFKNILEPFQEEWLKRKKERTTGTRKRGKKIGIEQKRRKKREKERRKKGKKEKGRKKEKRGGK